MQHYRLYFWGRDGHIARGFDLLCDDDAAAMAAAREHLGFFRLELWSGRRKVGAWEALALNEALGLSEDGNHRTAEA
ncbi:MAG TPA: hypothetical protein VG248_16120 [Caulobacteraceae bacterium]|jgi:hypothetical protein|nr:hypothetical protein [Caulobacteraceae bacterium]